MNCSRHMLKRSKKSYLWVCFIIGITIFLAAPAWADLVEISNPGDEYWNDAADAIAAKARNGNRTGWGATLGITDLNTAIEQYAHWDPSGYNWTFGNDYKFELSYAANTGTATFNVLEAGGNLLGSMTNVYDGAGQADEPNYAGQGIRYVRLHLAGNPNDSAYVNITNLTFNNERIGSGTYTGQNNEYLNFYFEEDQGSLLTDFTIAGDFMIATQNTNPDEIPRFEIDLSPVPIPAAIWLLGSGLLALVGLRRRKH